MEDFIKADGYFYDKDGVFVGQQGTSVKVYLASNYTKTSEVNPKTKNKKITIKYLEVVDLNINHSDFCYIAGVIIKEDPSSVEGVVATIQATFNCVKVLKGDSLSIESQAKWAKHLLASKYSSVDLKIPLKTSDTNNHDNNTRAGLIHVLLGLEDYSKEAFCWDGIDFAGKGIEHNKAKTDGGISISKKLWIEFVDRCNFKELEGVLRLRYGKHETKEEVLNKIPFSIISTTHDGKKISVKPYSTSFEKDSNILFNDWFMEELYESIGTGVYNKGRTLYKAIVVKGKQIFWKPYKEHANNKGYDWKCVNGFLKGKTIILFLFFIMISCSDKEKSIKDQIKSTDKIVAKEVDFALTDIGDTVRKTSYFLKNNYQLIAYPQQDKYGYSYVIRLKGSSIDTIIWNDGSGEDLGQSKYFPYYKGIDFEDCFVVNSSGGGNYSIYTHLFEKKQVKK